MSTITTRAGKGSPLTNAELDANFTNLNTDKAEKSVTISAGAGLTGGGDLSTNRSLELAASGVTAGSIGSSSAIPIITFDAYGRITAVSSAALDLSAYQPLDADLTAIGALAGTSGFLKKTAANTWALDTNTYLTGITSSQVTTALGFTPYNSTNPSGYISGITSSMVTTALGYTPPQPTGTGASGTWGINITGNAATVTNGITTSNYSSYALPLSGGTMTGNITINNASPTIYLQDTDHDTAMIHCNSNILYVLRGGTNATSWTQVGGYWPVQIDLTNNNMQCGGAFTAIGNVTAYSDESLKKDWSPLQEGFVECLAQVKSGTFTRKDTELRQAGVSAQSLQALLPEAVMKDGTGILSVAYGNAALASAVELAKEVVKLKSETAELKSLVAKLIEA